MRTRTLVAVSVAAAAALLAASCSKTSNAHPSASASTGTEHPERKLAPDFTLHNAEGAAVKLSDYRGKAVLLNFWATWCGPCTIEIPWFTQFEQEFKSRGLEIIGVSMDEDGWKAIKPYAVEHKINYPILLGNDSVGQLYGGVDSLPTTFVIGRDGKVAFVHVGLAGKQEYQSEILNVLGEGQSNNLQSTRLRMPAGSGNSAAK